MITKQAKAGDALPVIEQAIDQDRIMAWARISGDFNRLHVDPAYAAETRFKGTIAHGPMSLGFLNQLMMACFGADWIRGGQLLDIRFVAPIRPGDTIAVGGTIKEIREENGEPYAECDLFIDKAEGERAVVGRAVSRIWEKPS
ncbi:MAG: MaoC family dehydratase [Deltaproteobacteria bacterium]|nr:MaoC family dehydratase [Deltaproteobacteria bacterium]MBW1818069.1 MaoC family dehydratase [Deltaproteobacteria bacterium]MBW2283949.1 MaoC family dehydratase [Deltaproteobacteria bacterium]